MWWHRAWGGLRCLLFSLWHRKRVGILRDGHRLLTATEDACVCAHDEGGHRIDSLGRNGGDGDVHRGGHSSGTSSGVCRVARASPVPSGE